MTLSFDGRTVTVPSALGIPSGRAGAWYWGTSVTAGSDLDHDGRLEWAASGPDPEEDNSDSAVVLVFEGTDELSMRHPPAAVPRPERFGRHLAAGTDVDGDGYPDLAFTLESSQEAPRVYVAFDLDPTHDAQLQIIEEEGGSTIADGIALLPTTAGAHVLFAGGTGTYRWDLFMDELCKPGATLQSDEVGSLIHSDAHTGTYQHLGSVASQDLDGDGISDGWVGGRWQKGDSGPEGTTFRCPTSADKDVPTGCVVLAEEGTVGAGAYHATGDFDGDGRDEVATGEASDQGGNGRFLVYDDDGTLLAQVSGTHQAMFGRYLQSAVDDHGETWLLVGQANLSGAELGTVFAFRGSTLVGELVDDDADRLFTHEVPSFGRAFAAYRETPDTPLQLVVGSPYEDFGRVYVLPFEPPITD